MKLDTDNFFARICEALSLENTYGVQAEIAQILDISPTAVGFWKKKPPGADGLRNIIKIAELSNTSLHWLLTGKGDKFISVNNNPKDTNNSVNKVLAELDYIDNLVDADLVIESLEIIQHDILKRLKLRKLKERSIFIPESEVYSEFKIEKEVENDLSSTSSK